MMKTNKVLMAALATILAAGLSGCGRDNYQGTYTGYEVRNQATVAGQTQPTQVGYSQARSVSLVLTNNGDVVSGTYTVTNTNNGSYYPQQGGNTNLGQEVYQFTASSEQSNQLTNVMLFSSGSSMSTGGGYGYSMYSNCLMQGTLQAQNKGQIVSGTLSPIASANSQCGSMTLQLTRGN